MIPPNTLTPREESAKKIRTPTEMLEKLNFQIGLTLGVEMIIVVHLETEMEVVEADMLLNP